MSSEAASVTMFELYISDSKDVFVWSAEGWYSKAGMSTFLSFFPRRPADYGALLRISDWHKLRTEHRIIGNPIGSLASLPRQNNILGLPVQLLPEEVTLLLESKNAKLVSDQLLRDAPTSKDVQAFQQYREVSQKQQSEIYMEKRKAQVVEMIDKIIAGKALQRERLLKKKKESSEESESPLKINKEEILKMEFDKIVPPPVSNSLVQIFTADPWLNPEKKTEINWTFPSSPMEKLRFLTFQNLWEKGYYLTSGTKFGGDFLAYPGDPVKFHAHLIVVCVDSLTEVSLRQLVAYGRLGASNKKTTLLSSLTCDGNSVEYKTLTWRDKS